MKFSDYFTPMDQETMLGNMTCGYDPNEDWVLGYETPRVHVCNKEQLEETCLKALIYYGVDRNIIAFDGEDWSNQFTARLQENMLVILKNNDCAGYKLYCNDIIIFNDQNFVLPEDYRCNHSDEPEFIERIGGLDKLTEEMKSVNVIDASEYKDLVNNYYTTILGSTWVNSDTHPKNNLAIGISTNPNYRYIVKLGELYGIIIYEPNTSILLGNF